MMATIIIIIIMVLFMEDRLLFSTAISNADPAVSPVPASSGGLLSSFSSIEGVAAAIVAKA